MNQADLGLNLSTERTRKREFLAEMQTVVPWADLVALIAPYAPEGKNGRPPFAVESTLRVHFMRQCFNLSDPAMEEALHDVPLFREFANPGWDARLPDESTILRCGKTPSPRHLLERHELAEQIVGTVNDLLQAKGLLRKAGTVVDATLIAAPSSTENAARAEEEHRATDHVVCAVQPVHGAQKTAVIGWTSPSKAGPCSVRGRKCGANWTNTRHSRRHTLRNLPYC